MSLTNCDSLSTTRFHKKCITSGLFVVKDTKDKSPSMASYRLLISLILFHKNRTYFFPQAWCVRMSNIDFPIASNWRKFFCFLNLYRCHLAIPDFFFSRLFCSLSAFIPLVFLSFLQSLLSILIFTSAGQKQHIHLLINK